jgi:hypothetical protein
MREQNLLNARQPANEHRRVLAVRCLFFVRRLLFLRQLAFEPNFNDFSELKFKSLSVSLSTRSVSFRFSQYKATTIFVSKMPSQRWECLADPSVRLSQYWESLSDHSAKLSQTWETVSDPSEIHSQRWESHSDFSVVKSQCWDAFFYLKDSQQKLCQLTNKGYKPGFVVIFYLFCNSILLILFRLIGVIFTPKT